MSMNKKHYVAIAEITKNILEGSSFIIPMVNTLADYFARDNELFDKARFRTACLNGQLSNDISKVKVNTSEEEDTPKKEQFKSNFRLNKDRVDELMENYSEAKAKMYKKNLEIAKKNNQKN